MEALPVGQPLRDLLRSSKSEVSFHPVGSELETEEMVGINQGL